MDRCELVTGLLAGGVIVVFRLFVEGLQDIGLPGEGAENYEALPLWARMLVPLVAAVLLAASVGAPAVAWKTGTSFGHRDAWAVEALLPLRMAE